MALVLVCALSSAALAKPSIAILGLEVIDKTGAPSSEDVTFAKNLTEGLRGRAKIGGPYVLAPNGEKELIDLKLLKSCDDEKPSCMSSIGKDLQADFLIYGAVTRKGKTYDVSIVLLDVTASKRDRSVPTNTPVGTNGVALQNLSKKIYNGLTGQSDSCTITVKTPGVDRGTIQINDKAAGTITNGVGTVTGLSEGKYAIAIEANGFHRYTKGDISCTGGETTNIQADLSRNAPVDTQIKPPADTTNNNTTGTTGTENHEITGSLSHSHSSTTPWKVMAFGGLAATAVSAGIWVYGWNKGNSFNSATQGMTNALSSANITGYGTAAGADGKTPASYNQDDCNSAAYNAAKSGTKTFDQKYVDACSGYSLTKVAIPLTVGFAAVSAVGFIIWATRHDDNLEQQPVAAGRRKHHDPMTITPVVSANGGGATFRMEW